MIKRILSRIIGLSIDVIPSSLRQHSVIPSSLIGWVGCYYFVVPISHYHNHCFTVCTPNSVYPDFVGIFLEVHGFPRIVPMWTFSIRVLNSLQYHIFNIIKIRSQIKAFSKWHGKHMFLDNITLNHAQS